MTFKDMKSLHTFNEVLLDFFYNNLQDIQSKLTTPAGEKLLKKFKELIKSGPMLALGEASDYLGDNGHDLSTNKDIKQVLEYILNLVAHTLLVWAPYQIAKFDVTIRVGQCQSNAAGSAAS